MRWVSAAVGATAVSVAAIPSSAFAIDYLTPEQAAQAMFADADRFEPRDLALNAAQLQALAEHGVPGRSARWRVLVAYKGASVLGQVVLDDVIGKFERISYAVGLAPDGTVRQIEILAYRESHGSEVRLPAWRRQFVGKTAASPLRVGDDIANLSGATLSCTHVTEGVRRVVAVVALAHRDGLL